MCQHLFQLVVLACILMRISNTQLSKNALMRLFRPFGLSYTYPNMEIYYEELFIRSIIPQSFFRNILILNNRKTQLLWQADFFMMGDFNINLLRFYNGKYAQNVMLSLQSFNLTPTIDKPWPTRVHRNPYSLVDNILECEQSLIFLCKVTARESLNNNIVVCNRAG